MIPIRVKIVIKKDLINPRALQRVMKKKKPIMTPTMMAVKGWRKRDKIQIATPIIAPAIRVFRILFQSATDSSFRLAKKTNRRLNRPKTLNPISIQNGALSPVKAGI